MPDQCVAITGMQAGQHFTPARTDRYTASACLASQTWHRETVLQSVMVPPEAHIAGNDAHSVRPMCSVSTHSSSLRLNFNSGNFDSVNACSYPKVQLHCKHGVHKCAVSDRLKSSPACLLQGGNIQHRAQAAGRGALGGHDSHPASGHTRRSHGRGKSGGSSADLETTSCDQSI